MLLAAVLMNFRQEMFKKWQILGKYTSSYHLILPLFKVKESVQKAVDKSANIVTNARHFKAADSMEMI